MSNTGFEIRQALRTLLRAKGTTVLAIVILGAAMGLSTAAFSVADGVLFKPLPYPAADRLVELRFTTPRIPGISLTGSEFDAARAAGAIFEQVEGYNLSGSVTRTDGPEPEIVDVGYVTPGFLSMLGAPVIGRHFTDDDTAGSGSDAVILTHEYWKTRMGADPAVIGGLLHLEGRPPLRIVGALGPGFVFPSNALRLLPDVLRPYADEYLYSGGRSVRPIGRLRQGVTAAAADGAVPVDSQLRNRDGMRIGATPLDERMAYSAWRGLTLLFAGVLALLVIGVLDVSGLLLAAATRREREVLTRRALGATTGRLVRQLLLESLLVAAAAGALGVLLAQVAFATLLQMVPPELQLLRPAGIDGRALLFTGAAVVITAIVFGFAPMLHLARVSTASVRSGAATTPGRGVRRLSSVLVAGQVASAVVLVLVGALLVSSFLRVRGQDLGFDAGRLAFVSVSVPNSMAASRGAFYAEARRRLATIPGVESVAIIDMAALRNAVRGTALAPVGRSVPDSDRLISDTQLVVTPEYFRAAGIALLDGRLFTDDDAANAGALAIVNDTLARSWFPGERAVGQHLAPVRGSAGRRTIIGVVEDARHFSLKEDPLAEIFLPFDPARPISGGTFVVRAVEPETVLPQATAAIRAIAPRVPITAAETANDAVRRASLAERFYAVLLSTTAAMGLTLAALGLYGILSWSVSSRQRELGLRAALGADRRRIGLGILREVLPTLILGAALGAVLGWWAGRLASALLYEVQPTAIEAWLTAGGVITITAGVAMALPYRRACRISPAEALRQEP